MANSPRVDVLHAGCVQAVEVAGDDTAPQSRPATLREFELALRKLGFSARESKAIARDGFKALPGAAPETHELESVRQALLSRASLLKSEGIL